MATEAYANPYLDSSVFISWLNQEIIRGVSRFQIAAHIIKKAEQAAYPIWISALTLAEVNKLPRRGGTALTPEQNETIIQFFQNDCESCPSIARLAKLRIASAASIGSTATTPFTWRVLCERSATFCWSGIVR